MPHIDTSPDEVHILYAASNKLARASTPAEWLEAVSDYAREQDASAGVLFYILYDQHDQPQFLEVVANWTVGAGRSAGVGTRFDLTEHRPFINLWMSTPERPTLIRDAATSQRMQEPTRAVFIEYNMRGIAILPLNVKGRWVAVLMFTWVHPYVFDERDQRIFTALIQQAGPVIESVRLFEAAQQRARELEIAKNEIDLLYQASNRLARVSTPAELLDAVSDYARERGASYGLLTYLHGEEPDLWGESVAEWRDKGASHSVSGGRHAVCDTDPKKSWLANPDVPLLIANFPDDERFDADARQQARKAGRLSMVVLPLKNRDRWVGLITFCWNWLYHFTDYDQRVYTALIQQATPVADSLWLHEQSRQRAQRAEHLLRVNTALSQAADEPSILNALALYTAAQGADSMTLNYLDYAAGDPLLYPAESSPVAVWRDGLAEPYDPQKHRLTSFARFGIAELWTGQPEQVLYVEDVAAEARLSEENRAAMLAAVPVRAFAMIPLFSGGRYQGVVSIKWNAPHVFSDEEKEIYARLMQTLPSIVATRRAYLAEEEARKETQLLYRASEAINAANTFTEVMDALTRLRLTDLDMTLTVWENFNYEGAGYIEIVGTSPGSGWQVGTRVPRSSLRVNREMPMTEIQVVEDTANRRQIDSLSASVHEARGYHSFINVPLNVENRTLGHLVFYNSRSRPYSNRETRLAAGIGDLVAAALERIRLRQNTEASRARAELLALVNAALSQATDEQSILGAVSLLAESYGVALSTLAYLDIDGDEQLRAINIVALRSPDGSSPLPLKFLPVTYFRAEDYPILQVAYANPDEPIFIEDSAADPRTEAGNTRRFSKQLDWAATILVPLRAGEQWQGLLTFIWNTPQTFSKELRGLFKAVQSSVAAVVATRRAYLAAEEARQESELLYQAGTIVNSATTYQDIAAAIASLNLSSRIVTIGVFENYDFDSASCMNVVAASPDSPMAVGTCIPVDALPMLRTVERHGVRVYDDIENDPRVDPISRATLQRYGVNSLMNVPLSIHNRWMGAITFYGVKVRGHTIREQRLAAGIGDLVTAALERIRLQEQTETARQRAEMLAQVNAALSQAGDEWSILSAVALYLSQLQPDLMNLNYIDVDEAGRPSVMTPVAVWENGQPAPDHVMVNQPFPLANYPSTELWANRPDAPLLIGDAASDSRLDAHMRALFTRFNAGALVIIPLYSGGRWQGNIVCTWTQPRLFSDNDQKICENLLQTVGAVVASRRAFLSQQIARQETEQRAHELETIARMSATAASILNQDDLLQAITHLTRLSFPHYRILLYLLDEAEDVLALAAQPEGSSVASRISLRDETSLVARAAQTRQGVIVNDLTRDPDTVSLPEARSEMAVPTVIGDRLIGVLDVQSPEANRFNEADVRVMATLADLISVAIQNARLYQQAQEIAAFEERNRLARELHDSVSQALYGIALGTRTARILYDRDPAKMLEPLEYVMSLAEAGLTEMRALIFELRPESLENEGVIMALSKQAASIQARYGLTVHANLCGEPSVSLDIKEALYRIAREAMHNVVKHAHASQVNLTMVCDAASVRLEVRDNGQGFDIGASFPGHLGLQSMRERAERLGGRFTIQSAPGSGTHITVEIPRSA